MINQKLEQNRYIYAKPARKTHWYFRLLWVKASALLLTGFEQGKQLYLRVNLGAGRNQRAMSFGYFPVMAQELSGQVKCNGHKSFGLSR